MPSNAVTGTLFQVDQTADTLGIQIPYGETQLRFWRNTSVATTAPGQTASLQPDLLGYEWDSSPDNPFTPAGLIDLSSTTVQESTAYNTDWGNVDTSGTATHNFVEYRDPTSGALVFGAGTVFWSWGLSSQHDNSPESLLVAIDGSECPAGDGEPVRGYGGPAANAAGEPRHRQPIDRHDTAHIHHLHGFEHGMS